LDARIHEQVERTSLIGDVLRHAQAEIVEEIDLCPDHEQSRELRAQQADIARLELVAERAHIPHQRRRVVDQDINAAGLDRVRAHETGQQRI